MLGLAAALLCVASGPPAGAETSDGRFVFPKYDLEQEKVIRKQFADFTDAWNRHDVKAMMDFYALDADHVEPDLRMVRGRNEIEELFKKEHETIFKGSKLNLAIDTVWLVTDDVALVDGTYSATGVKGPDGKEFPERKGHLTGLLLKERGRWWVVASRAILPVPPEWRADFEKWTGKTKNK